MHSTPTENVSSIIDDNLDYRLVARCKFGRGISFTPCPTYADREGCRYAHTNNRAMIIAKVLIGKSHQGCQTLRIPFSGYDTTTDNYNQVYVKYNDDEFYPQYIVYYTGK